MRTVSVSEFQTDGAEKRKSTPRKVCLRERLVQQRDGRWTQSSADTFRDPATVYVNRIGCAPKFVRQNCQLVCDLLLDWQPMQLVQ